VSRARVSASSFAPIGIGLDAGGRTAVTVKSMIGLSVSCVEGNDEQRSEYDR
jgi:hypothetical protein